MKRHLAPIAFLLFVALAGCSSSTPSAPAPSAATTTAASTQPTTAPAPTSAAPPVSKAPTSAPAVGGTATDFCGAFKQIAAESDNPSGDMASFGVRFRAAASDMRKYAPADIAPAANTYADVIDSIGKAVESGNVDKASLSKAISDGMRDKAKDIGTVALWVAKNCKI